MTALGNNNNICDGCGKTVNNAGLMETDVISRMNFVTGLVENLHLCRKVERDKEDGSITKVGGCAAKVIDANIPDWDKRQRSKSRKGRASAGRAGAASPARGSSRKGVRGKSARRGGDAASSD